MRKSLVLVVRLFAEAQKAIKDMPVLLIMPLLTFLFYSIFLAYWIFTSLVLASFGKIYFFCIVIFNDWLKIFVFNVRTLWNN